RDEATALLGQLVRLSGRPEGMLLWKGVEKAELGGGPEDRNPVRIEAVAAFYIARRVTTNQEFYDSFVARGGYLETNRLWSELCPELTPEQRKTFVDADGKPGPAGWRDGRPPEGKGALPVTGISCYEARVFAAFVKKRLPTD